MRTRRPPKEKKPRVFKITTTRTAETFVEAENLKAAEEMIKEYLQCHADEYIDAQDKIFGNIVEVTRANSKRILDYGVVSRDTEGLLKTRKRIYDYFPQKVS
jgi:hypothetical protein